MSTADIPGQLNAEERRIITAAIVDAPKKPETVLEVGTWLGGGSTLHLLRALEHNATGHLWGIEADQSTYERMVTNIRHAAPEASHRFTPLFGFSEDVIPRWLEELGHETKIDVVFLDGGNNPGEQITEFELLDPHMSVGAVLMAHDAKLRKGKWLVPYISTLDNWESKLNDVSTEGLFVARKRELHPSSKSLRSARSRLLRMRLEAAELAAAVLPSNVCAFLLALLPKKLQRRLSEGRQNG